MAEKRRRTHRFGLFGHRSSSSRRRPFYQQRHFFGLESLEPRIMLDGAGFQGNARAPNLDLSGVSMQQVMVGQPYNFDLRANGAVISDTDATGSPTGDTIRLLLDPDVGTDTPIG